MRIIRRGDVWLAALDPTVGREIAKTRPVLVVSNDLCNRHAATVTVLPITSQKTEKLYPFEVSLPRGEAGLPKDSKAKADQVRTLDASRLARFIGKAGSEAMQRADAALRIHLALD